MEQKNLFLFTGENAYALDQTLSAWKKQFTDKHGAENLLLFSAKDLSLSDILDAVATMPFIAEKRLVILVGIPKIEKEDFRTIVDNIHPQTILAILEPKPDKRLGIVKEIEKHADVKRFSPLPPAELLKWMQSFARELGSSLSPEGAKLLLSITGDDQWMLSTELRKIAAFAGPEIQAKHIEALAVPSGSQVIWKLTDLIGSRKSAEALQFLADRIDRGEDAYGMWVILLNMIKNLGLVFAAVHAGQRDERSIASATGLHFLAVRGLLPLARSMDLRQAKRLIDWAADADIQLKSGGYHYTVEHQNEVIALAEKAILLCK